MSHVSLIINFMFVHSKAILDAQTLEDRYAAEAQLQDAMDTLLTHPNVRQTAARYLLNSLPHRYFARSRLIDPVDQKLRSRDVDVFDKLIGFIGREIDDGDATLIKMAVSLPLEYIQGFVKDNSGNLVSKILDGAIKDKDNAHGLFCLRLAAHQPDSRILNDTGYTQSTLPLLLKIRPTSLLSKNGSPIIKRHLISNDLGM